MSRLFFLRLLLFHKIIMWHFHIESQENKRFLHTYYHSQATLLSCGYHLNAKPFLYTACNISCVSCGYVRVLVYSCQIFSSLHTTTKHYMLAEYYRRPAPTPNWNFTKTRFFIIPCVRTEFMKLLLEHEFKLFNVVDLHISSDGQSYFKVIMKILKKTKKQTKKTPWLLLICFLL